jgi:signal transduction histidine kinase
VAEDDPAAPDIGKELRAAGAAGPRRPSTRFATRGGETREIRVRTSEAEDVTAEVCVDDTGIGFAAEVTARLYEPFFTTKAQGMGMGLAISRTIVELHRGRLSIEPRESGLGTTVRLVLPIGSVSEAGERST